MTPRPAIDRQLPAGSEIFLDHVGHFVADRAAASRALVRAGFALTPASVQVNPDGKTLTGTGNVTAMLTRGYVEILFKTAETPLAHELDVAIARHQGVHLAAFAVADARRAHQRLGDAGFPMRPLVEFQRPVETTSGAATAAFTVVRLERGAMPEGRIQMLTHRTEEAVWQPRWLIHPNGALGLTSVVFAVADVDEATARFVRFTGRRAARTQSGAAIVLDRGRVELVSAEALAAMLPEVPVPGLPFTAAYAIVVKSLNQIETLLRDNGLRARRVGDRLAVPFPDELGKGAWLFAEQWPAAMMSGR